MLKKNSTQKRPSSVHAYCVQRPLPNLSFKVQYLAMTIISYLSCLGEVLTLKTHQLPSHANIKFLEFLLWYKSIFLTWLICLYFHALMHSCHNFLFMAIPWFTIWLLLIKSRLWLAVETRSNLGLSDLESAND